MPVNKLYGRLCETEINLGGGVPDSLRDKGEQIKLKRYVSLHRGGGGSKMTEISVT